MFIRRDLNLVFTRVLAPKLVKVALQVLVTRMLMLKTGLIGVLIISNMTLVILKRYQLHRDMQL